jgi:hypothetical protein
VLAPRQETCFPPGLFRIEMEVRARPSIEVLAISPVSRDARAIIPSLDVSGTTCGWVRETSDPVGLQADT